MHTHIFKTSEFKTSEIWLSFCTSAGLIKFLYTLSALALPSNRLNLNLEWIDKRDVNNQSGNKTKERINKLTSPSSFSVNDVGEQKSRQWKAEWFNELCSSLVLA